MPGMLGMKMRQIMTRVNIKLKRARARADCTSTALFTGFEPKPPRVMGKCSKPWMNDLTVWNHRMIEAGEATVTITNVPSELDNSPFLIDISAAMRSE